MNKLKVALRNLRVYLHNDVEAVELLEEVARETNAIRKDLAAAKDLADEEFSQKEATRAQLLNAERQLAAANNEIVALRVQVGRLQKDLDEETEERQQLDAILESELDNGVPIPEDQDLMQMTTETGEAEVTFPARLTDMPGFFKCFKYLKAGLRLCPPPQYRCKPLMTEQYEFDIHCISQVIQSYEDYEMALLGR